MNSNTDTEPREAHELPSMALSEFADQSERHEKSVDQQAERQSPKGWNLALIMLSIYASMFLVGLVYSSSFSSGAF